jgi:pSer/pThr/pTyr-binding forkhead associated (FHA) protein
LLPTGDRVPLGEYVVSIGRANDCTVVLADPNVSRHHAEVRPSGDGFVVVDLGSTNGTKVNDARVAEHQLRDGDEVRFGNTVMHFQAS